MQDATGNPLGEQVRAGLSVDVPTAGPGGLSVSSESGSAGADDGETLLSIRATAGVRFGQDPPPGSLPDR